MDDARQRLPAESADKQPQKAGNPAVILWLIFAAILFLAAVFTWPQRSVPSLTEIPLGELEQHQKQWFTLQPDDYAVGGRFDTAIYKDSTLLFLTKRYPVFHIRITDGSGQGYWLAAQVSLSTYKEIESGQKTMLYGTLLPLEEKQAGKQRSSIPSGSEAVAAYYICDSGDPPFVRRAKSVGFALGGLLFVGIAILIEHYREE